MARLRDRDFSAGLQAVKGKHLSVSLVVTLIVYSQRFFHRPPGEFRSITNVCIENMVHGYSTLRSAQGRNKTVRGHSAYNQRQAD